MGDVIHNFELAVRRYTAGLIKADELDKAQQAFELTGAAMVLAYAPAPLRRPVE